MSNSENLPVVANKGGTGHCAGPFLFGIGLYRFLECDLGGSQQT